MSKTVVRPQSDSPSVVASVSFWQAFRFWLKLGFISFGGPAGQIAMMHQSWWITDAGYRKGDSCMRSIFVWSCPARRPSSWRLTSAG